MQHGQPSAAEPRRTAGMGAESARERTAYVPTVCSIHRTRLLPHMPDVQSPAAVALQPMLAPNRRARARLLYTQTMRQSCRMLRCASGTLPVRRVPCNIGHCVGIELMLNASRDNASRRVVHDCMQSYTIVAIVPAQATRGCVA